MEECKWQAKEENGYGFKLGRQASSMPQIKSFISKGIKSLKSFHRQASKKNIRNTEYTKKEQSGHSHIFLIK